jgi:hypothetical protein
LELIRGPVKMVAFVIFLHIGLGIFDWQDEAKIFFSRVLVVVVARRRCPRAVHAGKKIRRRRTIVRAAA